MIGYSFLSPAEDGMATAAMFYDNASLGLGSAFLDEITRSIELLRRYPKKGKAIRGGLRIQILRRFPFSLMQWRQKAF